VTGPAHNSGDPALADAALLAEQRRQARRTALLLGLIALGVYLGFIIATGLRN
jgi:hypothetical protein